GAFLCFGRGDLRDVVLKGHKIVGSAQRRRRGGILQHGSVLLRRSDHAPQFPGLLDLAPSVVLGTDFAIAASASIGALFGTVCAEGVHDSRVLQRSEAIEPRYQKLDWR